MRHFIDSRSINQSTNKSTPQTKELRPLFEMNEEKKKGGGGDGMEYQVKRRSYEDRQGGVAPRKKRKEEKTYIVGWMDDLNNDDECSDVPILLLLKSKQRSDLMRMRSSLGEDIYRKTTKQTQKWALTSQLCIYTSVVLVPWYSSIPRFSNRLEAETFQKSLSPPLPFLFPFPFPLILNES